MAANDVPRRQPNNKRSSGSRTRVADNRPKHIADWTEIGNQQLRDAICAITASGGAIMFGLTSDRGAYSITVLDGDQRIREWPHTPEECTDTLGWLVQMFSTE